MTKHDKTKETEQETEQKENTPKPSSPDIVVQTQNQSFYLSLKTFR